MLSFIISGFVLTYLSRYLIRTGKISFKSAETTKGKSIWTVICCAIYIVGYVLIDFLGLGIIGFNIARGILLGIFVTLLLFDSSKK
jgi:hypothetical protein